MVTYVFIGSFKSNINSSSRFLDVCAITQYSNTILNPDTTLLTFPTSPPSYYHHCEIIFSTQNVFYKSQIPMRFFFFLGINIVICHSILLVTDLSRTKHNHNKQELLRLLYLMIYFNSQQQPSSHPLKKKKKR